MDSESVEANRRRKAIYLLPNLFTTAAMFAGFYAIVAAMAGKFTAAAIAVLIAMLLDGVDGRVARLTNTQSEFGAQYDSLSDLVSFGMAPALVMYKWSLMSMADLGWQWGKIGWLAAFFYAAMAAMRLARFNVQIGKVDKRYFRGLASPSAATVMVAFVWACDDLGLNGADLWLPAFALTVLTGALMVSPFLYHSFKAERRKDRIPFIGILVVVLVLILVAIDPPKVFFAVFFLYALSGPALMLLRWHRKRKRNRSGDDGAQSSPGADVESHGDH
jgi:CDP-diacylglycerol--serine O-phosphatidyltransferase